ncbi:MAG: hypothetical protein ACXVBJ_08695 [Flavisolibacter sp.]
MRLMPILVCCILPAQLCFGQAYPKEYFLLKHKVDTFFIQKKYREEALTYSAIFNIMGSKASNNDRLSAACAWSLANYPDSAFVQLNIAATNGRYVDFDITSTPSLNSLHSDPRWDDFVNNIKKFDLPLLCTHTSNPPPISINFRVDPKSRFLRSDGFGSYLNGTDNVNSVSTHSYGLRILNSESGTPSKRSLTLDLNSPIRSSGAKAQGVISDHMARLHVFYKLDTTVKPWVVYNFRDMPVGSTVTSPRTEIYVRLNGDLHVLQLGYWGLGDCNEPDGQGGRNGGVGTTGVRVTRNSETEYTFVAATGSVGRLWDISSLPKTIDRGLFKTSFIVHLQYQ